MTNTALVESVTALRERVETLQLKEEATYLESVLRHREQTEALIEDWGNFVDPLDAMRSEPELYGGAVAGGRADRADDRRNGDFMPHFNSEMQVSRIRGLCSYLAETDVTVIGAFDTLEAFLLKQGYTCEVVVNEQGIGEEFKIPVQQVLDEFTTRVNWYGGVDKESLMRTRKVGTRFLRIHDMGERSGEATDGYADVEFYEPSWITGPTNGDQLADHYGLPHGLDWKYGVVTDPDNVSLVWGYYAAKHGDPKCGEFIPEDRMDRMKVNTDSNVKLGLPDLYAGRKWASKCEKLLERVLDGAAIQASIALIRDYPVGTPNAKVASAADGKVEFRTTTPAIGGGTATVKLQRFDTGQVVDQKGVNLRSGPLGDGHGESYIAVLQAGLRVLSRRWGLTEDAISGDASNNNRASLAEAGSTSLTRMQSSQSEIATNDVNVFWKVVNIAVQGGRIVGKTIDELKQLITIKVTPADIEHRDRKQESDIRVSENQAGVLSKATWASETGRDYEEERQKIESEPTSQPPMMGLQIHGMPGGQQLQVPRAGAPPFGNRQQMQQAQQVQESRIESLAERALLVLTALTEADDGDGHWVTINGEHVQINGSGTITSGPAGLRSKSIDHASAAEAHKSAAAGHTKAAAVKKASDPAAAREHAAKAESHLEKAKAHAGKSNAAKSTSAPADPNFKPLDISLAPTPERAASWKWHADQYSEWAKQMSPQTRNALDMYRSGNFDNINDGLRGKSSLDAEYKPTIATIDKAIASAPPLEHEATVYRAMGVSVFGGDPTKFVGKTFSDKAYVSTSSVQDLPNDWAKRMGSKRAILNIQLPKGTRAASMDIAIGQEHKFGGANQHEIILPRGSNFRVDSVKPVKSRNGEITYMVNARLV